MVEKDEKRRKGEEMSINKLYHDGMEDYAIAFRNYKIAIIIFLFALMIIWYKVLKNLW